MDKKFTAQLALQIHQLHSMGIPYTKLSKRFGVSRQSIYEWVAKLWERGYLDKSSP